MKQKIAIIGAGMAGLTLANRLAPFHDITVFEKARGVSGRMSTRHSDPFAFDHGTQFFTVRDKNFADFLAPHRASGLIQEWTGKVITLEADKKITDRLWFEPHYVACPGMNSLCKKLAEGLAVDVKCEITPLHERTADGWALMDTEGRCHGQYAMVISTAPPVQTARLLGSHLAADNRLRHTKMLACYTMMFGLHTPWDKPWIAAKIHNSPLEWMAINSTKPGRNKDVTSIVVHSSNAWAEAHADDNLQEAEIFLRNELSRVLKIDLSHPDYFSLHRWRYALLDKAHDDQSYDAPYYDEALQLASVGDWGSRSRIEDVWREANKLADRIMG